MNANTPFATDAGSEMFEFEGRLDQDIFDRMLLWATDQKTSDIKVQSGKQVRCHIAGRWRKITRRPLNHPEVEDVVRFIYGENGPGEVNSGHDLDPSYEVRNLDGKGRKRYRVNITACRMIGGTGFQLTLRTLPSQPIDIKLLGIEPEIMENLRPPQGLNLVTGPTGSGKSTLLSSAIRYLCEDPARSEEVLEYSRPIEYVYDGLNFPFSEVTQLEVGKDLRQKVEPGEEMMGAWAYAVRNALRRAPDIAIIGEARDKATIEGCVQLAMTGHLVWSTMHTIGVPETISRAIMPFPGSERRALASDLLNCLNLICTQLLVDRVGGGKVGCREYMLFDQKVKAALFNLDPDDWANRLREMLKDRSVVGSSMADSAKKLMLEGTISADTYEWIASRTAAESRLVREAVGQGMSWDAPGASAISRLAAEANGLDDDEDGEE
jgi:defect-in-organelle-trafficking protein DotB